ncbi:MAG: phosphatase PAP2 family protein [Gemmataceae bacterium]|nr:phosphatase PAP2 family protein [Gemmataceae bacterium]MCI0739176.1 phosphatase PAP2 family protein [Gemmataceae bacterium]
MNEPFTLARFVRQSLTLAAIMIAALTGYLVVLKTRGWHPVFVTWTPWDDFFPYQPVWVWVYLIPYLIGPPIIGLMSSANFRWYVQRGLVTVVVTLLIFVAMPTHTAPRPHSHDLTGPTAALYDWMIAIDDPPANAAPSLHVSLTCLLALALLRDFPRWWPVTTAGVILVWLATLFTRQHHLIDVATGVLLALVVAYALPFKNSNSSQA